MTNREWQETLARVRPGDFLGWSIPNTKQDISNLPSWLTQWGTGILSHIEIVKRVINDDAGKPIDVEVITANGNEVAVELTHHKIKDHMDRLNLYIMQYYDAAESDRLAFVEMAQKEADLKTIYNWDIIKIIMRKAALCKIWVIGGLFNKSVWFTPPFDKKEMPGTICSKSCVKYIRSRFPSFMRKHWVDYIPPSAIFDDEDMSIFRP